MELQTDPETDKFVTSSMIAFINQHIESSYLSTLDEIVLSYVVTVLENLAAENGSLEGLFDVEEFFEMLSAYFPEFEKIPHAVVNDWIFELVDSLRKFKADKKGNSSKKEFGFDSLLDEIDKEKAREPRSKRNSESSTDSGVSSGGGSCNGQPNGRKNSRSRTPRVSDNSESECDGADLMQRLQLYEDQHNGKTQTLMEMFPTLQKIDAQNFVALANGDLEKAVQMVLVQLETGEIKSPIQLTNRLRTNSKSDVDEKTLKDRIFARYGFIDQAEDTREYKPLLPKAEPKKMVRYREGQVVSTKGERYTEVQINKDGEETKVRSYLHKPNKHN
ncbi:CUE domain-containing protein 2 [Orchesella cincta]|uniref:CUE domain-containing protein 2 n=1 Tax=Orchesella cincta TaxID=48709 RepID=A0A1D2NF07_ORCCI|nr:CUE domain-containing protein 2 [Orchesella cincta]